MISWPFWNLEFGEARNPRGFPVMNVNQTWDLFYMFLHMFLLFYLLFMHYLCKIIFHFKIISFQHISTMIIAKHCYKIYIPTASLFHFNDPTVAVLNKNLRTLRIKEILSRTTLLRVYWFYEGPDYGNSRDKGPHHKKKKKITKVRRGAQRDGYAQKELTSV